MNDELVLIFDFGSQFGQLIARRVREQNVFCQVVRHDICRPSASRELNPKGIILSGGPASVYEPGAPQCDPALFDLGIPVLGICYGMQLACQALGGAGRAGGRAREYGRATLHASPTPDAPVPRRARPRSTVWMSHGDQVQTVGRRLRPAGRHRHLPGRRRPAPHPAGVRPAVPPRGQPHARTAAASCATSSATCAAASGLWKMQSFIEQTVADVRARVGDKRVICGLSGGVDSSVCAALLVKADRPAGGVHLRRQRPDARGRDRGRSGTPSATGSRPTCTSSTPASGSSTALAGRHRPAGEAARSSARCSSTCSSTRRSASRTRTSWPRARSTRT